MFQQFTAHMAFPVFFYGHCKQLGQPAHWVAVLGDSEILWMSLYTHNTQNSQSEYNRDNQNTERLLTRSILATFNFPHIADALNRHVGWALQSLEVTFKFWKFFTESETNWSDLPDASQ